MVWMKLSPRLPNPILIRNNRLNFIIERCIRSFFIFFITIKTIIIITGVTNIKSRRKRQVSANCRAYMPTLLFIPLSNRHVPISGAHERFHFKSILPAHACISERMLAFNPPPINTRTSVTPPAERVRRCAPACPCGCAVYHLTGLRKQGYLRRNILTSP